MNTRLTFHNITPDNSNTDAGFEPYYVRNHSDDDNDDDDNDDMSDIGIMAESRPQTGRSAASTVLSPMPDDETLLNHNLMAVKLNDYISAGQLAILKTYFNNIHLSATDKERIRSFHELWLTLSTHETIKPGEYSQLKRALSEMKANDCLSALKKLEKHGPHGNDESTALKKERQHRHAAEKELEVVKRARLKSAKGHRTVIKQTEQTVDEVLRALDQEESTRKRLEIQLANCMGALQAERQRSQYFEHQLYLAQQASSAQGQTMNVTTTTVFYDSN